MLLATGGPEWLVVNDTGLAIARQLAAGGPAEQVAAGLAQQYGLALEMALADVRLVAERLAGHGLLAAGPGRPGRRTPRLGSAFLHLTDCCNLACRHCYIARPAAERRQLPGAAVLGVLDALAAAGASGVVLSGGEPLLHPDIIPILRHAAARLKVQVLTNGTLIDAPRAELLVSLKAGVQVSLDGSRPAIHDANRGPGSLERALAGIDALAAAGMAKDDLVVAATVTRDNLADIPAVVELAVAHGAGRVRLLPVRPSGRARERWPALGEIAAAEYEALFRTMAAWAHAHPGQVELSYGLSGFLLDPAGIPDPDGLWCPVGRKVVVDTDGDAYPCVLLMQPRFRLGNIFQQTLAEMMASETMAGLCHALGQRQRTIARCQDCRWQNLCQAGCMGQAFEQTGTLWDTDRHCGFRQRAFEEAFSRLCREDAPGV
ncbi:MAG: PqqD family peptide modification chaperone [Thermodesulfobacteriota bacterium]